jgi:hypothetical protein
VSVRTPWAYIDEPLASIRIRTQSLMQGRSSVSYARQFALLLAAARAGGELTSRQLDDLRTYIATGAGRHYAARAIGRGEWLDVVRGGVVYARAGFADVGLRILAHHGRLALLHGASRMARTVRSVIDRPAPGRAP